MWKSELKDNLQGGHYLQYNTDLTYQHSVHMKVHVTILITHEENNLYVSAMDVSRLNKLNT